MAPYKKSPFDTKM